MSLRSDGQLPNTSVRYYGWNSAYPVHYRSWCKMWDRSPFNNCFIRNLEGFKRFVVYLGPVPDGMSQPTLGRKDHTVGYHEGNFAWQEKSDNSREMASRTNVAGKPRTSEDLVRMNSDEARKKMSNAAKARHHLEPDLREDFLRLGLSF